MRPLAQWLVSCTHIPPYPTHPDAHLCPLMQPRLRAAPVHGRDQVQQVRNTVLHEPCSCKLQRASHVHRYSMLAAAGMLAISPCCSLLKSAPRLCPHHPGTSGCGWPAFYDFIPGRCAQPGGHQAVC